MFDLSPIHLPPGQRVKVKQLLDTNVLKKWSEVSGDDGSFRMVGIVGIVMSTFRPHYYDENSGWIVEVYQYRDKRKVCYVPEELVALVVPPALRRAGMKESPVK